MMMKREKKTDKILGIEARMVLMVVSLFFYFLTPYCSTRLENMLTLASLSEEIEDFSDYDEEDGLLETEVEEKGHALDDIKLIFKIFLAEDDDGEQGGCRPFMFIAATKEK
jgi:hypothetical protein